MFSGIGRATTCLLLTNTLWGQPASRCGPPIDNTPGLISPNISFEGHWQLNSSVPLGTCNPQLLEYGQYNGYETTREIIVIYYPCTGDVIQIFNGPAFEQGPGENDYDFLRNFCGQDWYDYYVLGKTPGSFARRGNFVPLTGRRAATSTPTAAPPPFGQASQSIAMADVNGDGNPDVLYIDPSGVEVQLLDGSGNVISTTPFAAGFSPSPFNSNLIAADFNGDGKIDLAISYFGDTDTNLGGEVFVLLGNGDGTFRAPQPVNAVSTPVPIAAADFNGDGKLDIAVASVVGQFVAVMLGNGDGTFQASSTYPSATPSSLLAVDLNGDGAPDLAVVTGQVAVLLNSGHGTFGKPLVTPVPTFPSYVAYADFNHDGKLDLVLGGLLNAIPVLLGNGDGTFQAPVVYASGDSPVSVGVLPLEDGTTIISTVDPVTSNYWFIVVEPDGTSGAPTLNVGGASGLTGIAAADLNGDGQPDIITANSFSASNAVSVSIAQDGDQFSAPVWYPLDANSVTPETLAIGDMNGDSKPDVVVGNLGSISVFLGNGDGTLKPALGTPLPSGTPEDGGAAQLLALADFNRDGKLDAAVAVFGSGPTGTSAGTIQILLGKGDGTFQPPALVSMPTGLHPVGVAAGDLNGDGIPDLAVALMDSVLSSGPATLAIFLGQGDGTFGTARTVILKAQSGSGGSLAIGDLNGDGKPDLALTEGNSNFIDVLLGNGAGGFREVSTLPATYESAGPVLITDFNRDGIPDLVVVEDETGFFEGNGDGTFQTEQVFPAGPSPVAIASTKFSGSPGPDLVIGDYEYNTWLALFNPFPTAAFPAFFYGEVSLGSGVYYLQFPDGNPFGYYNFPSTSIFYHYDLGFEGFVPGSASDVYLYDFTSGHWWYTSTTLFPYLFDFTLNGWIYYFPNTASPGTYTTNPRYFSNLATGKIFTM